jgi:hypothetical protein
MASYKHLKMALEAIDFQSGAFFKELTLVLEPTFSKGTRPDKQDQSALAVHLERVIFKHVGVKSKIFFSNIGTYVEVADINANNILVNHWGSFVSAADGLKMIDYAGDSGMSTGVVDLKRSRISGDFSKYEVSINIDLAHFDTHRFTAPECASVILHEIGHWFTYCEMLDRVVTGNMLLTGLSRVLSGGDVSQREIAIKKAGNVIDMDNSVIQDLQKSTSDKTVVTVFITHINQAASTREGHSFYDINTWEMLSDQFATRHGAGRHLVTALDKLFAMDGVAQRRSNFVYYLGQVIKTALAIMTGAAVSLGVLAGSPFSFVAAIYLFLFCTSISVLTDDSDGAPIYDKPKDRFLRTRRQLVEQVKNPELPKEMVKSISEDIKLIDDVLSNYNERTDWFEAINNFLFSSSRRRRDSINFQRDLEKLSMNDLFLSAASLKTI